MYPLVSGFVVGMLFRGGGNKSPLSGFSEDKAPSGKKTASLLPIQYITNKRSMIGIRRIIFEMR
jgi:hypothetical protein